MIWPSFSQYFFLNSRKTPKLSVKAIKYTVDSIFFIFEHIFDIGFDFSAISYKIIIVEIVPSIIHYTNKNIRYYY